MPVNSKDILNPVSETEPDIIHASVFQKGVNNILCIIGFGKTRFPRSTFKVRPILSKKSIMLLFENRLNDEYRNLPFPGIFEIRVSRSQSFGKIASTLSCYADFPARHFILLKNKNTVPPFCCSSSGNQTGCARSNHTYMFH